MVPRLPPSGLYTEDGHLFHHINGQPLSKDEIERLREHNVPYQSRSRFTAVEDEQIRKNWARFAEKHGLDYDKAANYAGVPGYTSMFADTVERKSFNKNTAFWPTMCYNLPHRSACQVRRRIGVLFDTAILNGQAKVAYSKNIQWSKKDTDTLLQYYKKYGMSASAINRIGRLMKLPAHSCQNHLRGVLARMGPVPKHLYKKIWSLAMKHTEYPNGKAFERVVSKHIRRHRLESEEQYDTLVPFQTIAQEMVYSVDKVKDAWHVVLRSLQENCIQQQEDGKTSKQAWSGALNAVMESAPPISCEDYSKFLRILSDATPSGPLYGTFSRKCYKLDDLRSRLKEEGIVGFHAAGDDELMYLFDKTRYIMWRVNNLIFRRLKMHYTLKERIHILSLAYDYQFEFSSEHQGRIGRSAEKTDSPLRYLLKDLNLERKGFPALHRTPLVEAMVVYSLSRFDDWIPPTAFKKYVVSKDVLAMFPEKKNNSELIRQRDLETAMTFMDYEVDPELSSSESEGGSSGGDTQRRWPNVDNSHELPSATGREPQYSTSFENSDPPCSRAEKKSNSVVPEDTCVVEESELVSRKRKRMKAIDAATPADHTVCENQPSPEEVPPKKRRGKRKRAADDPQTSEEQERNAENAGDFPSNSVRNSKSDGTETLDVGGTLNDRDHTRLHASQRQRLPYSRE